MNAFEKLPPTNLNENLGNNNTDMSITHRRYKLLTDFARVCDFLGETYDPLTFNSWLLPQYFEYAHTHPSFNHKLAHRNGLWEKDGSLVGIACYEMDIGEAQLHVRMGREALLPQLLGWAERELSVVYRDGKRALGVWTTEKEMRKRELMQANGYSVVDDTQPVKIFDYEEEFAGRFLPDGFTLIDGTDIDYLALNACYWRGFNHGDTPDGDVDGAIQMCNAPRFDASLMTIVVAPSGEYACALGMWFDERNQYAYLEPLATVPQYRRMGLASVALTEAMKKTRSMGAKYCFGGGHDFYTAIGFKTICHRELWRKEW